MPAALVGRPLVGRPEGASSLVVLSKSYDSYVRMVEAGTRRSLCVFDMGDDSMIVGSLHLHHDRFAGALDVAMVALHRLREASLVAEVCFGGGYNLVLGGGRDPERFDLLESHLLPAQLELRNPGRPTCDGVVLQGFVTTERFGGERCTSPTM